MPMEINNKTVKLYLFNLYLQIIIKLNNMRTANVNKLSH